MVVIKSQTPWCYRRLPGVSYQIAQTPFDIVCTSHSPFETFHWSCLHGCEIACALKQTIAQCKSFLQGTLLVTNFTNLCKNI